MESTALFKATEINGIKFIPLPQEYQKIEFWHRVNLGDNTFMIVPCDERAYEGWEDYLPCNGRRGKPRECPDRYPHQVRAEGEKSGYLRGGIEQTEKEISREPIYGDLRVDSGL